MRVQLIKLFRAKVARETSRRRQRVCAHPVDGGHVTSIPGATLAGGAENPPSFTGRPHLRSGNVT